MSERLGAQLQSGGLGQSIHTGLFGGGLFAGASLDLNFAVTKNIGPLVTFTRASTATFIDSAGVLQTAATDVPRFDHNPTTGESLGLLVEESRTNLLLQSATLSTQSVTVTAAAHTLSFTGTGTVTLSGTSTAGPLVGTGTGQANRVSLTFTPTAGTLTLTVSGTVSNAQLELGAFSTSYIPTTTAAATRSADVASITGTNFSSWYRQDEGTVFADAAGANNIGGATRRYCEIRDNASADRFILGYAATNSNRFLVVDDNVNVADITVTSTPTAKATGAYKVNSFQLASNGVLGTEDGAGTVPTPNQLWIGSQEGGTASTFLNGTIRRLTYWPQRLPNSTIQAITQ